ncbi:hypothetical protein QBC42DRAFT_328804 [Cladorrhinum samala]|uniref:Uncharacterized protein n=1 Tax=Cladorrhinum samala TaxID=585594 RepID=A0AAV9HM71_9PEZI|nr:hypothetical protein QBC42DRAFT_328804 [Cladorrhinum samala]
MPAGPRQSIARRRRGTGDITKGGFERTDRAQKADFLENNPRFRQPSIRRRYWWAVLCSISDLASPPRPSVSTSRDSDKYIAVLCFFPGGVLPSRTIPILPSQWVPQGTLSDGGPMGLAGELEIRFRADSTSPSGPQHIGRNVWASPECQNSAACLTDGGTRQPPLIPSPVFGHRLNPMSEHLDVGAQQHSVSRHGDQSSPIAIAMHSSRHAVAIARLSAQ